MSDAPVLRTVDLSHAYEDVPVLNGVDLEVTSGERVFLIGANGAGKSTIALAVSGLIRPTSGRIELMGESIVGCSPFEIARRGVSYTPAGRSVFAFMTVAENLELGFEPLRRRFRRQAREIDQRIGEVLEVFPLLGTQLRTTAANLSGGMQRMLEVGRALMPRPRLLILDEPTLGLSGAAIADLLHAIEQIDRSRTSVLLIEQNVPVAAEVCDRGMLLANGRVTLSGTSDVVLAHDDVRKTYLGVI